MDCRVFITVGGLLEENEVFSRLTILILYILIPTVAEMTARRFIQGLLDANLMVAGFRRMLKGISDGDFLTDGDFRIHSEAKCLENLLASKDFTGKSFLSLLWDDKEREDFKQFVEASTDCEDDSAPACLRLHVRRKGSAIGLDACHVRVPDLFGAVEPYHLIAFKQDPEQSAEAEAEEAEPPPVPVPTPLMDDSTASLSESSLCSCRMVDSLKGLCEMTFLLDGNSEHFDLLEAHLRFARTAEDASGMPHLRKFARPTDWGWISEELTDYIWTCYSERCVPPPAVLQPMYFRVPGAEAERYLFARNVELQLASPLFVHRAARVPDGTDEKSEAAPLRFYLHMTDFAPNRRQVPNLGLISENVSEDLSGESDKSD